MHPLVDAFYKGRERFPKKSNGKYYDNWKKPKLACHVGAIYWGLHKKTPEEPPFLSIDYPEVKDIVQLPCLPCPNTNEIEGQIVSILIHLSDAHDGRTWPDKRVAEWLETSLKRNVQDAV